jgi:hypothetical protein
MGPNFGLGPAGPRRPPIPLRKAREGLSFRDLQTLLVTRADALEGCTEGSPEEAELASLADAIEAYEAVRRPSGKAPGGKG